MRDVAVDRTRQPRRGVVIGVVAAVVALVSIVRGVGDGGLATASSASRVGALLMIVASWCSARSVAGRSAGCSARRSRDSEASPARWRSENATRNPRRTAAHAAALMIGVGGGGLFAVFAASIKASIENSVNESFAGDLVVDSTAAGSAASARSSRRHQRVARGRTRRPVRHRPGERQWLDTEFSRSSTRHHPERRSTSTSSDGSLDDLGRDHSRSSDTVRRGSRA